LDLQIDRLIHTASQVFNDWIVSHPEAAFDFGSHYAHLADFIYDRLAGSLREQGYTAQEVDAVVSQRPQRSATFPSAWPPCAPLPRCRKRPRWPPPTSGSATS
jgi:glycyl-tRNA synthetase beta chain